MNHIIKNIKSKNCGLALCLFMLATISLSSCRDEVSLPQPVIKLSSESITAPSLESAFNIAVESNCDWIADIQNGETQWISISDAKNIGNGEMHLSLKPNTGSSPREAVVSVHNEKMTVNATLTVKQNPSSGDGMVSVSELRSLEGASGVTLDKNAVTRGVVVSNLQYKNFPAGLIAIEGSATTGGGIAVKISDTFLVAPGEEVEVNLEGAEIKRDQGSGMLVLYPGSNDRVIRTETTGIIPTPLEVTIPELATGDYESMYVKVIGQFADADIHKEYLYECSSFIDEDSNTVGITVLQDCRFAESVLPTGSGFVCGVAGAADGSPSIYPCSESDIVLNSTRFGGGFSFPYVFSLMTNTATNDDGRYIKTQREEDNNFTHSAIATDDSGVLAEWNTSTAGKYFRFWFDNSGHHNFQLGSWMDVQQNYFKITYPEGIEITDGFRVQFGWGGMKNAPRNWEVLYSTDNSTWSTGKTETTFSIPKDVVAASGKGFLDFTVDVYVNEPIKKTDKLSVMIRPRNNETISGAALSTSNGRAVFHSCFLIDKLPAKSTTAAPSGAVYFEPFDGLSQGADYTLGDKLAAMLNYAGDDITTWSDDIRRGLSGTNVRQRPGYAQIGYVNSVDKDHKSYKNEVGELLTPKLATTGNHTLSFKAMAYRNKAVFEGKSVVDIKGDMTMGTIEIIGGGSVNGQTSFSFGPMSHDSFKTFSFTIEGTTSDTQIKFSSAPGNSDFSRWFIDNICVK